MKKPKVYVVTSGQYSDYSIEAIFSNRAAAKRFIGPQKDDDDGYYGPRIEARDLLVDVPEKIVRHYLELRPDGSVRAWSSASWPWDVTPQQRKPVTVQDEWQPLGWRDKDTAPEEAIRRGFPFALAQPSGRLVCLCLVAEGTDEEAVRKSFYDRLAMRKAEVAGIAS